MNIILNEPDLEKYDLENQSEYESLRQLNLDSKKYRIFYGIKKKNKIFLNNFYIKNLDFYKLKKKIYITKKK